MMSSGDAAVGKCFVFVDSRKQSNDAVSCVMFSCAAQTRLSSLSFTHRHDGCRLLYWAKGAVGLL